MFFQILAQSPMVAVVWIAVILISLTVHEFAHALVANYRGDKTAEAMGRLTLNPLSHIDPIGFIPLLLFGFGWAKPVPFNPYNLKEPRTDAVWIALAGPFSNLIVAALAGIGLRILIVTGTFASAGLLPVFLFLLVIINLFLMFFNLIPIHPLDGSKLIDAIFTAPKYAKMRIAIAQYGPQVLMMLVLLSIFTSFNVFFFVSGPSFFACDLLVGESCAILAGSAF